MREHRSATDTAPGLGAGAKAPRGSTSSELQQLSTGQPRPAAIHEAAGCAGGDLVGEVVGETTWPDGAVGDLSEDPRTDAEALCLCALLWAPRATTTDIVGLLTAADFYRPRYGALFELIATHSAAGTPHDPASIAATITAAGTGTDHQGTVVLRALTEVTLAGAGGEAAHHYALAVARTAYRRGFVTAAVAMAQAAAELDEADLFTHLLIIGRERRTATQRLAQLREHLG